MTGHARRGAALGLLAAATFGVSAPLAKRLLATLSPTVLAGLLYLGAGLGLSLFRLTRRPRAEAPLARSDRPTLIAMVLAGGVVAPVLMLFGLQRTSAVTASLLLNLEAPFTIALAVLVFREHLGRAVALAMVLVFAGAAVLRVETGARTTSTLGMLLLLAACAAWALDNNLTQRLSLRDPLAIVQAKTLGAGTANLALGLALAGGHLPPLSVAAPALALGSVSYGASVVLDAYALRFIGAAREAAFFATAPLFGVLTSMLVLGEHLAWTDGLAITVMAIGVALLLRERHSHPHSHDAFEHAHVHSHDEHHQHEHGPDAPPGEPHAHHHRHEPLVHDHPHVPDAHHRHEHGKVS